MQPYRYLERRPGRPRVPWHATLDQEYGSRYTNPYAPTTMAEQHTANPYDNGYGVYSEVMPEAERERLRNQYTAAVAAGEERLQRDRVEHPRRGAISLGSPDMPPSAPPTFPPAEFTSRTPAAVLEAERHRVREQRRGAISSGSLDRPPPPLPSYQTPGTATVNPAALSGAAQPSISGRNRLRSPTNPWGPPPPPLPSERLASLDGASSQATANFNNDEDRTRPATFQEALERDRSARIRSRNLGPFARGSGSLRGTWCPGPPTDLSSGFPLSNERPSRGTTHPTHSSFSAAVQEAIDYDSDLAARGTDSERRDPRLTSSTERASPLSARDRQLEVMNRAVQPRNRARNGDVSRSYQDAADAMTRSNTRRRARPTGYEILRYDFQDVQSAEQRASYLRLSNEKIESFVQALPVHVILDLPADKQDCAICMEKYYGTHQRECPVRLPCNHVLGKACLLNWLKSSPSNSNNNRCPVCRTVLLDRVLIYPQIDEFSDEVSSEPDISDHHGEGFAREWNAFREDTQALWDLQHEASALERDFERIAERNAEHNEHRRTVTGHDQGYEHESWFREREENHQRELARLRRQNAGRMEMVQSMRQERRRRRTES